MPKKILVVDDEKPISDIIKFNLTKEGFDVDTAYDGEEAVQKVDEYDPDLMILDLMLPKKDGLEVAREVRQTHDMPIIMVTAKDTEIDKVLGLEMGADATSMNQTTPGGFNAANIPGVGNGELDSILNGGVPAAAPTNPASNMSLDDVLTGIM